MFALFNQDKKFIGYSPNPPNVPGLKILKKEIPAEYGNLKEWAWRGDYDTGGMFPTGKIIEVDKEKQALKTILEKYPLGKQIFNIVKQLRIIAEKENVLDPSFKEMSDDMLDLLKYFNK